MCDKLLSPEMSMCNGSIYMDNIYILTCTYHYYTWSRQEVIEMIYIYIFQIYGNFFQRAFFYDIKSLVSLSKNKFLLFHLLLKMNLLASYQFNLFFLSFSLSFLVHESLFTATGIQIFTVTLLLNFLHWN